MHGLLAAVAERVPGAGWDVDRLTRPEFVPGPAREELGAALEDLEALELRGMDVWGHAAAWVAPDLDLDVRLAVRARAPFESVPLAQHGVLHQSPYLPTQPSGGSPPSRWGDEVAVAGLLAQHGVALSDLSRHATSLEFPDPDAATGFLVRTAGHVVRERPRLEREDRWTALLADVRALVAEHDQSADGTVRLSLEYLLAVGERRGAGAAHQRRRMSFARDRATTAYYERRAGEYDDWYAGTGLFADRERPGWDEEVKRLIGLTAGGALLRASAE